jgi:SAM-dependent methyltransferase
VSAASLEGSSLSRPPGLPHGTRPSPNIWHHTSTYEVENRAVDPDGRLWAAMLSVADWTGRDLLDIGCGTGFHLPRFALTASSVVGVEPHPDLVALARRRTRVLTQVSVHEGTAQALPLPDASVDIVHARWAYFFGPGCEPGLAELDRVVRRGGVAMVIDNDATRSTFGGWFRRGYPDLPDPVTVERFWSTRGWTRTPVDMGWRFSSRADLEAVVRIEFDKATADWILAHHEGTEVDYAVNLWSKRF